MSMRHLIARFEEWRETGEELVLATVVETAGSTYSKAGRHLLIDSNDQYAGLVGGGCLEGDLVLQASEVRATQEARLVAYDMRDDADDIWGMGLGCRGMMRLLLQPVSAQNDWQPFAEISQISAAPAATLTGLIIDSTSAGEIGTLLPTEHAVRLSKESPSLPALIEAHHNNHSSTVLLWNIVPWPRLLILGGGPDAVPVIKLADELGWETTVADHRDALIDHARLSIAAHRKTTEPGNLRQTFNLSGYNAVIVMSHHLSTDIAYLKELSDFKFGYIGVLGPAARKQEILRALEMENTNFGNRLHGPVGMDLGADTPASIALALIAEIHAVFNARISERISDGNNNA